MRLVMLASLLLALASGAAQAQWTDAGWTKMKVNSSAGGYVISGSAPGVSAVAPSGGSTHNYIYEEYQDIMSANGQTYDISIAWTYTLYGNVNVAGATTSYCSWPGGTRSSGLSSSGTYDIGPTTETHEDTVVVHPGGTVTVYVNADAQSITGPPGSSSSSSVTLNGSYTP